MTVKCKTGKTGYLKGQARQIAELRSNAKGNPKGSVYYCEKCTYYHVTRQNRKRVKLSTWKRLNRNGKNKDKDLG